MRLSDRRRLLSNRSRFAMTERTGFRAESTTVMDHWRSKSTAGRQSAMSSPAPMRNGRKRLIV